MSRLNWVFGLWGGNVFPSGKPEHFPAPEKKSNSTSVLPGAKNRAGSVYIEPHTIIYQTFLGVLSVNGLHHEVEQEWQWQGRSPLDESFRLSAENNIRDAGM